MCERVLTSGSKRSSLTLPLAQHTSKSFWCAKAATSTAHRHKKCLSIRSIIFVSLSSVNCNLWHTKLVVTVQDFPIREVETIGVVQYQLSICFHVRQILRKEARNGSPRTIEIKGAEHGSCRELLCGSEQSHKQQRPQKLLVQCTTHPEPDKRQTLTSVSKSLKFFWESENAVTNDL